MPTFKSHSVADTLSEFLEKTRKRLSDEDPDYYESQDEEPEVDPNSMSEENPDETDKWLAENDKPASASSPEYSEYEPGEDEEKHQVEAQKPVASPAVAPEAQDSLQPSREELAEMREYTRPWERRARDKEKLEAQPHVNPIKHHQGRLIEARNVSHGDRAKAFEEFKNTSEYQKAGSVKRMRMESQFDQDWHKKNPEHLLNALTAHQQAHKKGGEAMPIFNQSKDEKIQHIAGGGVQPESFSAEEGLQHAGGSREDDDKAPGGISQDPSARFAAGNQEFLRQYMKNYDKRAKKYGKVSDLDTYDPETRADVEGVLGEHPALKDPARKKKFDRFVEKYHPLIGKASRQVLAKLGLTEKAKRGEIDPGLLHEAGTHALFQAVNDYDHDHPSKASFKTHLNQKMHGLMQSALKAQDEIPDDLKHAAKKFDQQRRSALASPIKHTTAAGTETIQPQVSKRSSVEIAAAHPPEVQERLKRIVAAKAPVVRKQVGIAPKPIGPKRNVNIVAPEEEE